MDNGRVGTRRRAQAGTCHVVRQLSVHADVLVGLRLAELRPHPTNKTSRRQACSESIRCTDGFTFRQSDLSEVKFPLSSCAENQTLEIQ